MAWFTPGACRQMRLAGRPTSCVLCTPCAGGVCIFQAVCNWVPDVKLWRRQNFTLRSRHQLQLQLLPAGRRKQAHAFSAALLEASSFTVCNLNTRQTHIHPELEYSHVNHKAEPFVCKQTLTTPRNPAMQDKLLCLLPTCVCETCGGITCLASFTGDVASLHARTSSKPPQIIPPFCNTALVRCPVRMVCPVLVAPVHPSPPPPGSLLTLG